MACSAIRCCSAAARSESAWLSARRAAQSHGRWCRARSRCSYPAQSPVSPGEFGALLYETRSLDPGIIGLTLIVTTAITLAAALPAVKRALQRALRVDPSAMLRAE